MLAVRVRFIRRGRAVPLPRGARSRRPASAVGANRCQRRSPGRRSRAVGTANGTMLATAARIDPFGSIAIGAVTATAVRMPNHSESLATRKRGKCESQIALTGARLHAPRLQRPFIARWCIHSFTYRIRIHRCAVSAVVARSHMLECHIEEEAPSERCVARLDACHFNCSSARSCARPSRRSLKTRLPPGTRRAQRAPSSRQPVSRC